MNKKTKNIIGVICFLLIFCGIYLILQEIFIPKSVFNSTAAVDGFYALEEDTLDVAFLGSSQMFCTVDARLLTEEYDISSYDFGASSQQLGITYYYFQELLKTQSPRVIMVEMCKIFDPDNKFAEGAIAWNYAPMPFSVNKFKSAVTLFDGDYAKSTLYTVTPLLAWHARWEDLEAADVEYLFEADRTYQTRGFLDRNTVNPQQIMYHTEDTNTYTIPEENATAIRQIAMLAEDENIKVVFFKAPVSNWTKAQADVVKAFMQENNMEYIEMNDYLDELEIDPEQDFHNISHLNSRGAEKATRYLAEYILSLNLK